MCRHSTLILVLLVVGLVVAAVPAMAADGATRTEVSGFLGEPYEALDFGDGWFAGHTFHLRGVVVSWTATTTDDRLVGTFFIEFNANVDTATPFWDGVAWGSCWVEGDGVRLWEGSFTERLVGGIEQGSVVMKGVGDYQTLHATLTYVQTGPYMMELHGVILDPGGE